MSCCEFFGTNKCRNCVRAERNVIEFIFNCQSLLSELKIHFWWENAMHSVIAEIYNRIWVRVRLAEIHGICKKKSLHPPSYPIIKESALIYLCFVDSHVQSNAVILLNKVLFPWDFLPIFQDKPHSNHFKIFSLLRRSRFIVRNTF